MINIEKPVSLQEIKDEFARERGFKDWQHLYSKHVFRIGLFELHTDEVARRYARAVAEDALRKAAYNAELTINDGKTPRINKESILNTKIELP